LAPPPSANPAHAQSWRAQFDSPFAAAFYPRLTFGDPVAWSPVRASPPTGVAAGIIARAERRWGVGRAPGNLTAATVVGVESKVSPDEWADLHAVSFDVFRPLPDGIRLMGARTLSSDVEWRYLHTRRLVTHIERVVRRRMTWVVFEPNTPSLWHKVVSDLDSHVLRPLFEQRAFAGTKPENSYFIRCDETTNPREERDLGRMWCEIGVAPNTPAEYIVFRLVASRDNGLQVQEVE
jgi:phage tail sheath protein FI